MFHTERTHTFQKKIASRQVTVKDESVFPSKENIKRNKAKSTLSRNRKLFSSSSPFVNIKKDIMPKPNYKTSTQSLAMTRGLLTN